MTTPGQVIMFMDADKKKNSSPSNPLPSPPNVSSSLSTFMYFVMHRLLYRCFVFFVIALFNHMHHLIFTHQSFCVQNRNKNCTTTTEY